MLISFIIDLVRDFPLSEFERDVPEAHQGYVYQEGDDWKVQVDLIVHLRIVDHNQENKCKQILKMDHRIDHKIPDTNGTLVPIGVYLIIIDRRICNQLSDLATLKSHLLLKELIFHL